MSAEHTEHQIDRRKFLTGAAAVAGGVTVLTGLFDNRADAAERPAGAARGSYDQPNIVFIVVDEMRFPQVFPAGISTPGEFLKRFMPNLYSVWAPGVKFGQHFTAGVACSPGRACFATGLYPMQTWLLQTRTGNRASPVPSPALDRAFPTYGKILRQAGYETPYVGKWHLSPSPDADSGVGEGYLDAYGFQGLTMPDIIGMNGDGLNFDGTIARQGAAWLAGRRPDQKPFCLTVSFVNPHDKQFFWAGTEAERYAALFQDHQPPLTPAVAWPPDAGIEAEPPRVGYPSIPPNWESAAALKSKPTTQVFAREFQALVWGGVTDDHANGSNFYLAPYGDGADPKRNIAYAPYTYWERALDSYTQVLSMVDDHIGTVLHALPEDVARNTVFVMTSDHGEYAGAHGLVSGKLATAYDEAFHIPLIVADPTGRFTGDTDTLRSQLTSSVDVLPMLASLGYGDRSWMSGDLAATYAERLDLMPVLRSSTASGRDHVVLATNEHAPQATIWNNSPQHIYVMRTPEAKVAVYSGWYGDTSMVDPSTFQYEFYDYTTEGGRAELDNTFDDDPRAKGMAAQLMTQYLPGQLAAPLPPAYQQQSAASMTRYLTYIQAVNRYNDIQLDEQNALAKLTAFGEVF
ncbi:sulfatase-like hydrolase/transferase [Rhodococcus spelaei]|uniref:Sulfatase-like hydrolase/transferase n=1 Tax=Rhodococcus spelaei TaxID=2546320 RepID=A0A541B2D0_9NOCA|nr:sulfatase-like hydrolase/transferase [Rhodococcus spelaei]TQF66484.1 sulfatase-like hydrolase/transferase [Rhodococcus spelaei]